MNALYLRTPLRKLSDLLYRNPRLLLVLLLGPPLLWFTLIYLGSLGALLWQGFYSFDDFSMSVLPVLTFDNYARIFAEANRDIILRTLAMAGAVTLASAVIAFPVAYYMAVHAGKKMKAFFYIGVMLPMWASYIVKAYSWTVILAKGGILYWMVGQLGLLPLLDAFLQIPYVGGSTLSTSHFGRFLVFTYLWLPFMILPIQAAIERIPHNLTQASQDLGADMATTFRHVLLPLAFPGIVAGSIFTFSLTLGDYIIPTLIGPSGLFIGNFVYVQQGAAGNIPLAAAFTVIPIILIAVYLAFAKRLGAFDAL
ncbi:ABC transporter permease [Arenimonas sp. GDDSR-1]|uniref:ABC transporter permease n=1 Tax=Arenimonas sp. GDDSR-1 TaxID=2950125 RepID=UPI002626F1E5|nr:ABC transporter permease [Arenimonas sp. GDDSR-1]